MILYAKPLLDALQAATGMSDEQVDHWLLNRAVIHEKDIPARDWHEDPDGCAYEVYLNVVQDIATMVKRCKA